MIFDHPFQSFIRTNLIETMPKKTGLKNTTKAPKKTGGEYPLLNLFNKEYTWDDKDEVLDAVYWSRQIVAIFMGFIYGFLAITGSVGIISFCLLNSLAAYMIAMKTGHEFEPDENFSPIKEGFMTTFATFLVSWIVTYTAINYDQLE